LLVAIGGWFEFYDLFMTAYVGPSLVKSGIYSVTTSSFFGFNGLGAFVAASFAGLFIGTFFLAKLADRFGRKAVFTASLLWYSLATFIMAFQDSAQMVNVWRLIAGIGVGVELVVIDTYVSELVPAHFRGRAFAFVHFIQYLAVPSVAFIAWWFEQHPLSGLESWRVTTVIGATGALVVWVIRRRVPESARWLAQKGRLREANQVVSRFESNATTLHEASPLAEADQQETPSRTEVYSARFSEIWQPPFRRRTLVMLTFHLIQSIGFYGFASWVPSLLAGKGITVTHSLLYSFIIAIANPIGPLIGMVIADRIERKTMIVVSAFGVALFGGMCAVIQSPPTLIVLGVLLTFCNTLLSAGYHAYQTELFPTRIRAHAVGFVYSLSRLSAMFSGFFIAFTLRNFGAGGVFMLITSVMLVVMLTIGLFGPRTNQRSLDDISK
jgi:putative MFS transporter